MRNIRIFGVNSLTGIGTHSQSIFQIAGRYFNSNFDFEFINRESHSEVQSAILSSIDTDVNICFLPETFANELKGIKIYYCVFEASRPNPGYEEWLGRYDYIFSPSQWGKDCMIKYGMQSDKIYVIPEGVDPFVFHPYYLKNKSKDEPFRIFMLGKYESRKGYEVAFEAFKIAQKQLPFIELNIKPDWITPRGSIVPDQLIYILNQYRNLPIVIMSGSVNTSDLISLYRRAELFLFPSLCEGWGLPLIEAIACGVPAISCDFGGHSEFLKQIPSLFYKIPYIEKKIKCEKWKETYFHDDGDWGNWAEIDAIELADCIVKAVTDINTPNMGILASKAVREKFSWATSVDLMLNIISKLN